MLPAVLVKARGSLEVLVAVGGSGVREVMGSRSGCGLCDCVSLCDGTRISVVVEGLAGFWRAFGDWSRYARKGKMWIPPESVPRTRTCGDNARSVVGLSGTRILLILLVSPRILKSPEGGFAAREARAYPTRGIRTFPPTRPVKLQAALMMPSVPAENSVAPSVLNARARQLPLCRRVRHRVSTVPKPLQAGFASFA